jgi:DMSO/TMAO reductase YedYZ molybdopterin-dependent catalytic subunit
MSERRLWQEQDRIVRDALGPNRLGRRDFINVVAWGSAGFAAAAAPTALAQAPAGKPRIIVKDDSRLINIGATVRTGPWHRFNTLITPIEQFYVRNHYPTPTVDSHPQLRPENWRLQVHGDSVERPMTFTYDDLLRLPARSMFTTLECHGNGRTLFWEQQKMKDVSGGNWGLGAVGLAEWRYVPISEILGLVGLRPGAVEALFWSGVDGAGDIGRPMPVRDILERPEVIGLAYKMNGIDLPADHGYPVRALIPGWGGAASTKWITEIKISPHRFWVRLNTRGETFIGPDYKPEVPGPNDEYRSGITAKDVRGVPVRWMNVKSLLTVPLVLRESPSIPVNYPLKKGELPTVSAGQRTMTGYAWAPHGIRRVEYRIDGGGWERARLIEPNLGRYTWVRFDFPWVASRGIHTIETRATDRNWDTQPASVPFNELGMSNNAIPRFEIQVV